MFETQTHTIFNQMASTCPTVLSVVKNTASIGIANAPPFTGRKVAKVVCRIGN